jgi:hypothetical protein
MIQATVSKQQSSKGGLLPLVVGVTGHRDLAPEALPDATRQVRVLFALLRDRYPNTPIVLLSSLAEGADRLVAHVALDSGAELYAVLPLPIESYERDFTSPESLQEFRELLGRSYDSTIAPLGSDDDPTAQTPGPARDRRYAAAGAFIVSYSQIVIALWDGRADERVGGTSQIVRFALQGVPDRYRSGSEESFRTNETGAVYRVPVDRDSGERAPDSPRTASWHYPGADAPGAPPADSGRRAFEESLRSLDRFNRDAKGIAGDGQASLSAQSLLPAPESRPFELGGVVLEYTRTLFGQADTLALRCRDRTHLAMIAIFVTIGFAVIFLSLYMHVWPEFPGLYVAFLSVVALAFAVYAAAAYKRLQDRFQDYRALAEGLRVQFYWELAGIRESVYDHYLARQEGELDWIRDAMRAARLQRQVRIDDAQEPAAMRALLEIVLKRWINDQAAYFTDAARAERRMATLGRIGANACLVASAVVAILLLAALADPAARERDPLFAALTASLAGAGLFTGYGQKRAHEEHARRYERMGALYRFAGDRVAVMLRENNLAGARRVLLRLGSEALAETCDWLLLHRERRIDVPTA